MPVNLVSRFRNATAGLLIAFAAVTAVSTVQAQQPDEQTFEGYVTAVHLPSGFDVNGEHVSLRPDTIFGYHKGETRSTDNPARQAIQLGAYVWATGPIGDKALIARTVDVREDWLIHLSGLAVIDKMIAGGPEPEFRADGYIIRVNPSTAVSFQPPLKTISDVAANVWVEYEGARDRDGVLNAASVRFLHPMAVRFKALKGAEVSPLQLEPPHSVLCGGEYTCTAPAATGVRFGSLSRWHALSTDQSMQVRVQRIGGRLVPAYQKALPPGESSKIDFRFYAVDWPNQHQPICSLDGIVLVPTQLIERLKTDDQLAAILADGIAYHLQRQAAQIVANNRVLMGVEGAADVAALTAVPFINLPVMIGESLQANALNRDLELQRSRVALGLMADAGYDPWQAPESWRLAEPRRLPKDTAKLKYPERSGYQLGLLRLQYSGAEGPAHMQDAADAK